MEKYGCDVSILECYQQVFHSYTKIKNKKIDFSKIDTLIVTSNNILIHLYNLFYKKNKISWLLNCKIFCIGLNMKEKAKKLGWKKIYFLKYSNNEFIYKKILYFFRRKRI
ncbi:uroporphyrinogen-III synthase [Buchnera aphidicola]|uniref:uroporphyrinogen-III synthase n=1 Tax=Buchnera aphidicola TaxID=9 RepID=UPI003D18B29F